MTDLGTSLDSLGHRGIERVHARVHREARYRRVGVAPDSQIATSEFCLRQRRRSLLIVLGWRCVRSHRGSARRLSDPKGGADKPHWFHTFQSIFHFYATYRQRNRACRRPKVCLRPGFVIVLWDRSWSLLPIVNLITPCL